MDSRCASVLRFSILVMLLILVVVCAAPSSAIGNGNDKAANDRLAENYALVAKWKEQYGEELSWDIAPSHEGAAIPDKGDMQQDRALAVVIDIIREKRGVGIDFFDGLRPFVVFSEEKIWTISLLPEDPTTDWGFFVSLNAQDGTEHSYREVEPQNYLGMDNQFVDETYFLSQVYKGLDMSTKLIPSNSDISQEDALDIAVRALHNMKWETPSTLNDNVITEFDLLGDSISRYWLVVFGDESNYIVKLNAETGVIHHIYVADMQKVSFPERELNTRLGRITSEWEDVSPIRSTGESDSNPISKDDDLPISSALNIAFDAFLAIKGIEVESLDEYTPNIEFHDYPNYGRFWEITIQRNEFELGNTPLKFVISSPNAGIKEISDPSQG